MRKLSFSVYLLIALIIAFEFFLNLIFIDRTRPIWIVFVSMLGWIIAGQTLDSIRIKKILVLIAVPALIFVVFASVTNKVNEEFGLLGTMSAYVVSGIGYLDDLASDPYLDAEFVPIRTFLPISKVLQVLGLIDDVPSEVLQDRYIPYATNVGTIHEPYLSDGGIVWLVVLFPIIVFSLNAFARRALHSNSVVGVFNWANCCFAMAISFFVPKFNAVPFYIFVLMYFVVYYVVPKPRSVVLPRYYDKGGSRVPMKL